VLVGLMALYVGPLHSYFTTWRQSRAAHATVASLQRDHRSLTAQHRALMNPATLEQRARALGMVRPDERSYVVVGLPKR
jgi:cell division protein FtsB